MAEGTHFRPDADIGRRGVGKLARANPPDLARQGRREAVRALLLGPFAGERGTAAGSCTGWTKGLRAFGTVLMGGDTVATTGTGTYGLYRNRTGNPSAGALAQRSGRGRPASYVTGGPLGGGARDARLTKAASEHLAAFNRPMPASGRRESAGPPCQRD